MTQTSHTPPAPPGRRSMAERRGRERRILLVGLVLSVVVHAGVIVVVGDWLTPERRTTVPRSTSLIMEPPRGMRAIQMRIEPASEVPRIAEPDRPRREEAAPSETERVTMADASPDTVRADDRTVADRLAPRIVDPRLWQPMILIPREPTLEDVQSRIAAAVELLSDSALAEAESAMRARDWTVADRNGGKWGISPGKLHLGSITLPLPIWFPEDPQAVAKAAQWYELDQQFERTLILESFEDRVRAIRQRRERERAEAAGGGGGDPGG